jgi:enoyl-CoA hydratase/carnithine racemase
VPPLCLREASDLRAPCSFAEAAVRSGCTQWALAKLDLPALRSTSIDQGFDLAQADPDIRVVIVRGTNGVFSAGHDLSPGRQQEEDPLERYNEFKKYNLDLLLKWRDFPKPTIAMVDGYCIYAGWMLAAVMDLVFASDRAQFLVLQP